MTLSHQTVNTDAFYHWRRDQQKNILGPFTRTAYSPTWPLRCWGPDEEWGWHMPARSSIPPTGSVNNEFLKGSTGWGGVKEFFFFFFRSQSSSAWLVSWSAHSWTLNGFQLPNVGASATSDSEGKPIITTTELALSFKLGGLGTFNSE